VLQKTFQSDGGAKKQTFVIGVRFYLNPEQVEAQTADNPEYQTINPLGLTIVEFIDNRSNTEPGEKQ
jgi:type IV secretion system protein VirB5